MEFSVTSSKKQAWSECDKNIINEEKGAVGNQNKQNEIILF